MKELRWEKRRAKRTPRSRRRRRRARSLQESDVVAKDIGVVVGRKVVRCLHLAYRFNQREERTGIVEDIGNAGFVTSHDHTAGDEVDVCGGIVLGGRRIASNDLRDTFQPILSMVTEERPTEGANTVAHRGELAKTVARFNHAGPPVPGREAEVARIVLVIHGDTLFLLRKTGGEGNVECCTGRNASDVAEQKLVNLDEQRLRNLQSIRTPFLA